MSFGFDLILYSCTEFCITLCRYVYNNCHEKIFEKNGDYWARSRFLLDLQSDLLNALPNHKLETGC